MILHNTPSDISRYFAMMSILSFMSMLCRSESGGGVASVSAINASKQRKRPTGGICMMWSLFESAIFVMSTMSQKPLVPISVNVQNKTSKRPPNHYWKSEQLQTHQT